MPNNTKGGRRVNPHVQPDRTQAERFLTLLDPSANRFTFQTFDDIIARREARKQELAETNAQRKAKGLKPRRLHDPFAHIIHGTLDQCWDRLCQLNAEGAGIFVTVNQTDFKGRSNENVVRLRARFVDLDGAPIQPVLQHDPPPRIVVESSSSKFQAYWSTADDAEIPPESLPSIVTNEKGEQHWVGGPQPWVRAKVADQFKAQQITLAKRFGGDPSVHDMPRVMRLPGFIHRKITPFRSRIIHVNDALPCKVTDLVPDLGQERAGNVFEKLAWENESPTQQLNSLALDNLAAWVPEIFPAARPYHDGFRVSSADLERGNQEDLSLVPEGVKDFGVHDLGDPREGKRTPIDIVMEHVFKVPIEEIAERSNKVEFEKAREWLRERVSDERQLKHASKPPSAERVWPTLMPKALHGLAGKVVEVIGPHTESDPVALLLQFLVSFGNTLDRGPHYMVEGTQHSANLFVVLVGDTSKSRKGTSADRIRQLMSSVDPFWVQDCIHGGLSSGEGLIWQIRDEVTKKNKDGEEEIVVDGVDDKRLLLDEREFFQALTVMKREGNTVSRMVRDAWDGRPLISMTKNSPARCVKPHISLSAHITEDELRRTLDLVSMANGYANRCLFACVRRSKELPFGGSLEPSAVEALGAEIKAAHSKSWMVEKQITMDAEARALWASVYHDLSTGLPGLLGAITGRAEAQTIRLALLYALLDVSDAHVVDERVPRDEPVWIKPVHLRAALALWKYCEDSARYIFGDSLGDPFTDELLRALRNSGGMSRTQIRDHFGRNKKGDKTDVALAELKRYGKAQVEMRASGGKGGPRVEFWIAV